MKHVAPDAFVRGSREARHAQRFAALAAHEAIIDAERPISLTVSAPAAISMRRTSARVDVRF